MTRPGVTWVPAELHAHTLHSDGRLTLTDMARESRRLGLDVVALMDHNTISGHREIPGAERESGVTIIPGMELTTFYGHLLAFGVTAYVEWRSLTRENIDSAIAAVHAAGGLAGVAHPFHPGNPFCTGCCWEFDGPDWSHVDYLEVWSEADPWTRPKNHRAFGLWNDLLAAGHHVVAVSARDFHSPDSACLPAVTYLGVRASAGEERDLVAGARDALRAGRVFVTLGPLLFISVRADGADVNVDVSWGTDARRKLWEPHVEMLFVSLQGEDGELCRAPADSVRGEAGFSLPAAPQRLIRAELHGRAKGAETLIAFTNPVYLE